MIVADYSDHAEVIDYIFDRLEDGASPAHIANEMSKMMGIPTGEIISVVNDIIDVRNAEESNN